MASLVIISVWSGVGYNAIIMLAGFGMFAGNIVGGRDHTTVINGINRVEAKRKEDPAFNNTIETIIKKLDTNA